jgi:hypothetical protein
MGLETVTNIADLVATNPTSSDPKSQGDDHIRNIKSALLHDFAGFAGAILVTGVDGGAADVYTLTPASAIVAYTSKMLILFVPTATNLTTSPTINISGLGAKSLKDVAGNAPLAGDFVAGRPYLGEYDGTDVRMMAITKNYADQLAMSAVLPAQPGTAAAYNLQSLTGSAAWELKNSLIRRAITGADTVGLADIGNLIEITSGTFTLAFSAAATLGDRASGLLYNSGTGDVTLDPNGAETIDGLTTRKMYPGEIIRWYVTGGNFKCLVLKPFYMKRTSTVNFVWPSGYLDVDFDLSGGAGGGGSGRRGAAGSARRGGAAGGAPGRCIRRLTGIAAGTSITVTIGAGGAGGAVQTADDTNGNAGTAGGDTTVGAYFTAFGGAAGIGGVGAISGGTTSGSGSVGRGASGTSGNAGGLPIAPNFGAATANNNFNIGEGGAGVVSGFFLGSCSDLGGAGSGQGDDSTATPLTSGSSIRGVSAAGCGGWITTVNTMPAIAGTAGLNGTYSLGGGAAGGTCGASPTAGTVGADAANDLLMGNPGGGGGSSITAAAAAGGQGGSPSGPGGGGGASLNGNNSGAGGAGRDGRCIISGRT